MEIQFLLFFLSSSRSCHPKDKDEKTKFNHKLLLETN